MNLPAIFIKVGDFTFGREVMPSFWKYEDRSYYGDQQKRSLDAEARQKFIDFVVETFRRALEHAL